MTGGVLVRGLVEVVRLTEVIGVTIEKNGVNYASRSK